MAPRLLTALVALSAAASGALAQTAAGSCELVERGRVESAGDANKTK